MTKPQDTAAIAQITQKPWDEWVKWLDARGARELGHGDIAKLIQEELSGKIDSAGWWSQGITVAYEQHIGRRVPGQRSDGTFEVSVSKTISGNLEDTFATRVEQLNAQDSFDGEVVSNVRTSITPVRSYWRCNFADGTKLTWSFEPKGTDRVFMVVQHTAIKSAEQSQRWEQFWAEYLKG